MNGKAIIMGGVAALAIIGACVYILKKGKVKMNEDKEEHDDLLKMEDETWEKAGKVIPAEDISAEMFGSDDDPVEYPEPIADFPEGRQDVVIPNVNGGLSLEEAYSLYSDSEAFELAGFEDYASAEAEKQHVCMYFVLDDVLADDDLNPIDGSQDLYIYAVNSLMSQDSDEIFVKSPTTGDVYEIMRSEGNYLEAKIEAGIDIDSAKEDDA